MFQKASQHQSRISMLRPLAALLATALSIPALAQSVPFPTYTPGENLSGTAGPNYPSTLPHPWVVSDGTIITPGRHPGLPRHHDPRQGHRARTLN